MEKEMKYGDAPVPFTADTTSAKNISFWVAGPKDVTMCFADMRVELIQ